VYFQSQIIQGEKHIPDATEVISVITVQTGSTDSNRYVMMSGDIDSRISDVMNFTDDLPGANDYASGVAGTLEASIILRQYKFSGSIIYAALAGEEQGLFGGKILAETAQKKGGVINNTTARIFAEGTRYNETDAEARCRRYTGGKVDSSSRNLARYIDLMADRYIPNVDTMVVYRLDRFGRSGHHRPFNDLDYPGVRIMETNEHYGHQHQDLRVENSVGYGDTIGGVNFDYAAKLTALNAVSLAGMACAPSPPEEITIKGAVQPSTVLSWAALEKPKQAACWV
jgi:hypothetical protein